MKAHVKIAIVVLLLTPLRCGGTDPGRCPRPSELRRHRITGLVFGA